MTLWCDRPFTIAGDEFAFDLLCLGYSPDLERREGFSEETPGVRGVPAEDALPAGARGVGKGWTGSPGDIGGCKTMDGIPMSNDASPCPDPAEPSRHPGALRSGPYRHLRVRGAERGHVVHHGKGCRPKGLIVGEPGFFIGEGGGGQGFPEFRIP